MTTGSEKSFISIGDLPPSIRHSRYLSAGDIALLTRVPELPFIDPAWHDTRLQTIFQYYAVSPAELERELHFYAKELLSKAELTAAWQVLLSAG